MKNNKKGEVLIIVGIFMTTVGILSIGNIKSIYSIIVLIVAMILVILGIVRNVKRKG